MEVLQFYTSCTFFETYTLTVVCLLLEYLKPISLRGWYIHSNYSTSTFFFSQCLINNMFGR